MCMKRPTELGLEELQNGTKHRGKGYKEKKHALSS